MATTGRNAPCPCGSGRKHKQCCLARAVDVRQRGRTMERVWESIQDWTSANHPTHLDGAVRELLGDERPATTETVDLLCSYMHLDRELEGGGTPAERFARLPALDPAERAAAEAIAAARLGVWRVRAVDPGHSIQLEEVVGGERVVTVTSRHVSRATERWDVVLGRVVPAPAPDGHELWGPAASLRADEEDELVAEVERLAAARSVSVRAAFRLCAAELLRFSPPSRSMPPSFFTFEGDELVSAYARWEMADDDDAAAALENRDDVVFTDETEDGEGLCFEWTAPRSALAARRPELPPRAVLIESTPIFVDGDEQRVEGDTSRIGLGTFELRPGEVTFHAISARRLEGAIALIAGMFGERARLTDRDTEPLEPGGPDSGSNAARLPADDEPGVVPEVEEAVIAGYARARFAHMLDEPDPRFGGLTPRVAARTAEHRQGVERWLRRLENSAAHSPATEGALPDVAILRRELALPDDSFASAA